MLPKTAPILALGGDLKNALTLVVDGQAFASQHIGDLDHLSAREAFAATVRDMCAMYEVRLDDLTVAHDLHPGYRSTEFARSLPGRHVAVQHHRAHVASVLAERAAWETPVIGFAFDGTGYGDDGSIWGGEVFTGSLADGLTRVAHLRRAFLPGGDAAARFPVQAAAGFLYDLADDVAFDRAPFLFPDRYVRRANSSPIACAHSRRRRWADSSIRSQHLSALPREQSFEGQAAMWLEHCARSSREVESYPFPFEASEADFRPMLRSILADRMAGRPGAEIARAFHAAVADLVVAIANSVDSVPVVVSGGVFQNALLMEMLAARLGDRLWFNTKRSAQRRRAEPGPSGAGITRPV